MKTPIAYEVILQRYPESVNKIMQKLQKGKSKEKNSKPEEFEWCFDCSVEGRAYQFNDILNAQADRAKEDAMTIEQKLKDYASRCHVYISASKGRWWGSDNTRITIPPEIIEAQRKQYEADQKEKTRIANLTPEQKDSEIEQLLKRLRGTPGFIEIRR
jgi:hypothetical protein